MAINWTKTHGTFVCFRSTSGFDASVFLDRPAIYGTKKSPPAMYGVKSEPIKQQQQPKPMSICSASSPARSCVSTAITSLPSEEEETAVVRPRRPISPVDFRMAGIGRGGPTLLLYVHLLYLGTAY